jgi:hypothetical protein
MIVWNRFSRFLENDPAEEHVPKQRKEFSEGTVLKPTASSSNSAAGCDGHDARDERKDGRHPQHHNHGRIAGH